MSKNSEPLGMVGSLIAMYKGKPVGVGPGKLSHEERRDLWKEYMAVVSRYIITPPRIAQVKVKRDPSYSGLRQPTFQHWRDDQTEPNEEM